MPIEKSVEILRKDRVRMVAGRSQSEGSLGGNIETRREGDDTGDTRDYVLEGQRLEGQVSSGEVR